MGAVTVLKYETLLTGMPVSIFKPIVWTEAEVSGHGHGRGTTGAPHDLCARAYLRMHVTAQRLQAS